MWQPISLTSNHSIVSGDDGSNFIVSGSSVVTVTYPTWSTSFSATFITQVINHASRGVKMIVPGVATFWLLPGQQVRVGTNAANNGWTTDKPIISPVNLGASYINEGVDGTLLIGADGGVDIYVDPSGSDANDGLASGASNAFGTLQNAWNFAIAMIESRGRSIHVLMGEGTFTITSSLVFSSTIRGAHIITFYGDTTGENPENYKIQIGAGNDGIAAINIADYACALFVGIEFSSLSTTNVILDMDQFAISDIAECEIGTLGASGTFISLDKSASASFSGNITIDPGSCAGIVDIEGGGTFEFGVVTYTCNTTNGTPSYSDGFATARGSGTHLIFDGGATFTGTGAGSGSTGNTVVLSYNATCSHDSIDVSGTHAGSGVPGASGSSASTGGQFY